MNKICLKTLSKFYYTFMLKIVFLSKYWILMVLWKMFMFSLRIMPTGINIQIMPKVFILGCIYTLPAYRDKMKAEGPKHIPIF